MVVCGAGRNINVITKAPLRRAGMARLAAMKRNPVTSCPGRVVVVAPEDLLLNSHTARNVARKGKVESFSRRSFSSGVGESHPGVLATKVRYFGSNLIKCCQLSTMAPNLLKSATWQQIC